MPAVDQRFDTVGAHELRTVQQSQALLALEAYRFPAELIKHISRRSAFAAVPHFALADQRQEQVG